MSDIYTLGIDVGSTASKCIILKNGCEIVSKSLIGVGAGTSGPERAIKQVLDGCGMKKEDMAYTLATGYGRNSLMGLADQQMSELSCHAKGATFLFPDVHTVIDIGGQDVKILHIENGAMVNFAMNDKCAAGTGRFLDVMARVLEVRVDDLDKLGALSTKDVAISSTCTVFAESEVISQLAQGTNKNDIIAGIHRAASAGPAAGVGRCLLRCLLFLLSHGKEVLGRVEAAAHGGAGANGRRILHLLDLLHVFGIQGDGI